MLSENRNGLVCDVELSSASGTAETEQAGKMLARVAERSRRRRTCGADKAYDTGPFVRSAREHGFTPHVARKNSGGAIDRRTTTHPGYLVSQRKRKRVEEIFGWGKTVGPLRKMKHKGSELVRTVVTMTAAAYNIMRIVNLETASA